MSTFCAPLCTEANCPASRGVIGGCNGQCPVVASLQNALRDTCGHTEFRPGQLDAALAALHGHDVFVCMSTGAGKSLCMFLPTLACPNSRVGVIISPLNCLMDEQVSAKSVFFLCSKLLLLC